MDIKSTFPIFQKNRGKTKSYVSKTKLNFYQYATIYDAEVENHELSGTS